MSDQEQDEIMTQTAKFIDELFAGLHVRSAMTEPYSRDLLHMEAADWLATLGTLLNHGAIQHASQVMVLLTIAHRMLILHCAADERQFSTIADAVKVVHEHVRAIFGPNPPPVPEGMHSLNEADMRLMLAEPQGHG